MPQYAEGETSTDYSQESFATDDEYIKYVLDEFYPEGYTFELYAQEYDGKSLKFMKDFLYDFVSVYGTWPTWRTFDTAFACSHIHGFGGPLN